MVEAAENMFHSQFRVAEKHLEYAFALGDDKLVVTGIEDSTDRAVPLQYKAYDHAGSGRSKAFDLDRMTDQAFAALNLPFRHHPGAFRVRAGLANRCAPGRQHRNQICAGLPLGGLLPADGDASGIEFTQFKERGGKGVGVNLGNRSDGYDAQDDREGDAAAPRARCGSLASSRDQKIPHRFLFLRPKFFTRFGSL